MAALVNTADVFMQWDDDFVAAKMRRVEWYTRSKSQIFWGTTNLTDFTNLAWVASSFFNPRHWNHGRAWVDHSGLGFSWIFGCLGISSFSLPWLAHSLFYILNQPFKRSASFTILNLPFTSLLPWLHLCLWPLLIATAHWRFAVLENKPSLHYYEKT